MARETGFPLIMEMFSAFATISIDISLLSSFQGVHLLDKMIDGKIGDTGVSCFLWRGTKE